MEKFKLGDICDFINGRAFKPSEWEKKGLPIVRIQNLNDENAEFNFYSKDIEEKYIIDNNQLLFSWSGTPGTSFGAFFWNRGKAVLNQHIFKIIPKIDINIEFLKYLLNGNLNTIISKSHGGVGLKHITKSELEKIVVHIPEIKKQEYMVKTLNQTLEIINNKKNQLKELDILIKSQFVEMFENEKYPKKTLNELTNKITDGSHNPPTGIAENEGYMMLSSQNIINNSINYENVRFLKKEDFEKENLRTNLNRGDVLLTIVGTVGRTAIITDETNITLQRSVAVLKPTKEINSIYLVGAINSDDVIRQLNKGAKGVAQKGIYLNDIKKILIAVPPIELQNQFAEIVKQIDKQKFEIENSLKEMQEIYESLMEKYFG